MADLPIAIILKTEIYEVPVYQKKGKPMLSHTGKHDILALEANNHGEDIITTDIHGSYNELVLLLKNLNPQNRLVIAGDLTDKGRDSLKTLILVVQIMQEQAEQEQHEFPQLFLLRGNHEDMLLHYLESLELAESQITNFYLDDPEKAKQLMMYCEEKNIAVDTLLERWKSIAIDYHHARSDYVNAVDTEKNKPSLKNKRQAQQYETILENLTQSLNEIPEELQDSYLEFAANREALWSNGGEWAEEIDGVTRSHLIAFLSSLPYIIHVKGKDPFNVVHADLPISQAELEARLDPKHPLYITLTETEKLHTTWARPAPDDQTEKNTQDTTSSKEGEKNIPVITYCGHTIGGGVRLNNHHINLDIGTYYSHCLCVVNHQERSCEIIGEKSAQHLNDYINESNSSTASSIQEQINQALLTLAPPVERWTVNDVSQAAKSGNLKLIHEFVEQGGSLEETDLEGRRPLEQAIIHGQIGVIYELGYAGANCETLQKNGQTLSDLAHEYYPDNPNLRYDILVALATFTDLSMSFNSLASELHAMLGLLKNLSVSQAEPRSDIARELHKALADIHHRISNPFRSFDEKISAIQEIDFCFAQAEMKLWELAKGQFAPGKSFNASLHLPFLNSPTLPQLLAGQHQKSSKIPRLVQDILERKEATPAFSIKKK